MDRTKDIEFNGNKYQISKLPAKDAMWIAMQLFTKIIPYNVETQLDINNLPANRQAMSEEDFNNLVDTCLLACKRYEKVGDMDVPLEIMKRKGEWAIAELEYDFGAVMALLINVLAFNIKTFFDGGVLDELTKSFKGLRLFNTQA